MDVEGMIADETCVDVAVVSTVDVERFVRLIDGFRIVCKLSVKIGFYIHF
jgi:hypothetical protein